MRVLLKNTFQPNFLFPLSSLHQQNTPEKSQQHLQAPLADQTFPEA